MDDLGSISPQCCSSIWQDKYYFASVHNVIFMSCISALQKYEVTSINIIFEHKPSVEDSDVVAILKCRADKIHNFGVQIIGALRMKSCLLKLNYIYFSSKSKEKLYNDVSRFRIHGKFKACISKLLDFSEKPILKKVYDYIKVLNEFFIKKILFVILKIFYSKSDIVQSLPCRHASQK